MSLMKDRAHFMCVYCMFELFAAQSLLQMLSNFVGCLCSSQQQSCFNTDQ